ncbi:MAG: YraN family protein [Candidatus Firestonebacteria bacterium]
MFWKRFLGQSGEDAAVKYLKKNSYKIITRNYKCRYGEIDIIAKEKDTWCFIEVKTIGKSEAESPFETISAEKIKHIENSAAQYVSENKLGNEKIRFDAVGIRTGAGKDRIELIKGVF